MYRSYLILVLSYAGRVSYIPEYLLRSVVIFNHLGNNAMFIILHFHEDFMKNSEYS